jgi:hypothetical protein
MQGLDFERFQDLQEAGEAQVGAPAEERGELARAHPQLPGQDSPRKAPLPDHRSQNSGQPARLGGVRILRFHGAEV